MKRLLSFSLGALAAICATAQTQDSCRHSRLQIGGYGEAVYSRNFYSDSPYRYSTAASHKNDKHGRFDLPHVSLSLTYDFGKGWSVSTEFEFEHGGTGGAYEKEFEEGGEWENEVEKGGEVEIEQFWIQKTFKPWLNVRAGHIVVPVGYINASHEPLNFFTVYRPEGESTILPGTWHQTGLSLWGRTRSWRYEVMCVAGLNSANFTKENWIQGGAGTPFEFEPANKLGFAARIDNYSIPGLRLGLSGYYGHSSNNGYNIETGKNFEVNGAVAVGSFDFTFDAYNWIVVGNADFGYLGNAKAISEANQRQSNSSPYPRTLVGDHAVALGIEAGYDLFSRFARLSRSGQNCYLFARYDYYDSYNPPQAGAMDYPWTERSVITAGINYKPIPQIVLKAQYSQRLLKAPYNNEPSISFGVAYEGFFIK